MSYYQTTPLTSDELKDAITTAKRQDDAVLALFRRLRTSLLAPSDVHLMLRKYGRQVLLTSVRRSLSSLTEEELLIKTGTLRPGPHGKPEHCWKLADKAAV